MSVEHTHTHTKSTVYVLTHSAEFTAHTDKENGASPHQDSELISSKGAEPTRERQSRRDSQPRLTIGIIMPLHLSRHGLGTNKGL